jgi:malonyl CoA-acyl carrier protein transacylase
MGLALLFPGQGSQTDEMRETVRRYRPDLLEALEEAVGKDVFERAADDTSCAQPAIYCASLATWTMLERPTAELFAGHSMGEISALAAAGAIDEHAGLRLVATRGRLMQEAAEAAPPNGMLAVMVRDRDAVERCAADCGVIVANDNAPQQLVLAGTEEALSRAAAELDTLGMRTMQLPVAGAFHSPVMEPAVTSFRRALRKISFREPTGAVISCVTAEPFDEIPARLLESITSPVRWREVALTLGEHGADEFIEVGPGKVLSGLVRRILPGTTTLTAERAAERANV